MAYAGSFLFILGSSWFFFHSPWLDILLPFMMVGGVGYLGYLGLNKEKNYRQSILGIFILLILEILFLAILEQSGSSISLFTERYVDRSLIALMGERVMSFCSFSSRLIPTSIFQALPCGLMLIVAPLLVNSWNILERFLKRPMLLYKFEMGFIFLGIGFLLLKYCGSINSQGLISPWIIIGTYFFYVIGELCVLPVILSTMTILPPAQYAGRIWGVFFLAIASAHRLSGWLAYLIFFNPRAVCNTSINSYFQGFEIFSCIAIGIGFVLVCMRPVLKRLLIDQNK
jgi:POT family proton-dependent oligopeptide transporter